MSRFWTDHELEYLDQVYPEMTMREIAENLGRSLASVDRMIDKRFRKPLREDKKEPEKEMKTVGRFMMEFNGRNWRQIGMLL